MAKLWAVIKREYLERVRTKWFVIGTFLGPLLFGTMIILPTWLSSRSAASADLSDMLILDATGTELGYRVAADLGLVIDSVANPDVVVHTRARVLSTPPARLTEAESTATRDVMRRAIRGYLVLDEETLTGDRARYAGRNASSIPDMERLRRVVRQDVLAYRLERAGLDPERAATLTRLSLTLSAERITDEGRGGSGLVNALFAFGVAFVLYVSIVLYGQTVLRGVMEEKTTRVAEVVVSSVRPETLLAGKVIGVGAVGLTQQIVWIVTSLIMVKAREPLMTRLGVETTPLQLPDVSVGLGIALLLFFVLGFTFYAALFAAVGAMVSNEQDAQQAATPVILLVVLSAIFIQPVILAPAGMLARVMSWLPFSAPIIMPLRLTLIPISLLELTGVLAGLALSCVAAIWIAARVYRVGLLMYGKRPTMREVGRWVRES
jgi:ABC-2 type transport system permease protein